MCSRVLPNLLGWTSRRPPDGKRGPETTRLLRRSSRESSVIAAIADPSLQRRRGCVFFARHSLPIFDIAEIRVFHWLAGSNWGFAEKRQTFHFCTFNIAFVRDLFKDSLQWHKSAVLRVAFQACVPCECCWSIVQYKKPSSCHNFYSWKFCL